MGQLGLIFLHIHKKNPDYSGFPVLPFHISEVRLFTDIQIGILS
jgi:hypothetical protein